MTEAQVLCLVPPALSEHVLQLLQDGGVEGQLAMIQVAPDDAASAESEAPTEPQVDPDRVAILVRTEDGERAKSVLDLVLPELMAPKRNDGQLRDRLVRSDAPPVDPLPVWRGPNASLLDEPEFDDDDDEYHPPEPPPVEMPRDLISLFAWAAVILGPILLIVSLVLSWDGLAISVALLLFFGGFGTLIWRSADRPPRHQDPDNGAVV